jgi:hypothetical protein
VLRDDKNNPFFADASRTRKPIVMIQACYGIEGFNHRIPAPELNEFAAGFKKSEIRHHRRTMKRENQPDANTMIRTRKGSLTLKVFKY